MSLDIQINGVTQQVSENFLSNLLHELGYKGDEYAVAINGSFIARHTYQKTPVKSGDVIDIVAPIAGG